MPRVELAVFHCQEVVGALGRPTQDEGKTEGLNDTRRQVKARNKRCPKRPTAEDSGHPSRAG